MTIPTIRHLVAVVAASVLIVACGDDDASTATLGEAEATEDPAGDAAPVGEADTDLGTVLVDSAGLTLYGFLPDEGGTPTCVDGCAEVWPPMLVDGGALPAGLDADTYAVVERPDGSHQLVAGGWPLYTYAADGAPGDVTGQGVDDTWFAVAPDGTLVRDGGEGTTTSAARPGY